MPEQLSRSEALAELGITEGSSVDETTWRAFASTLVRRVLARWGASQRAEILRYTRQLREALELEEQLDEHVRTALEQMETLGEVVRGKAGRRWILIPQPPFGVRCGDCTALLGIAEPNTSSDHTAAASGDGQEPPRLAHHVRWVSNEEEGPKRMVRLVDWLGPPIGAEASTAHDCMSVEASRDLLRKTWDSAVASLDRGGAPAGDAEGLAVFAGRPGEFCGKWTAPNSRNRWRAPADADDGAWPGVAPSAFERHRPCVIRVVEGRATQIWSIEGKDAWELLWWYTLGRGVSEDSLEQLRLDASTAQRTLALPKQLLKALEAFAIDKQGWRYTFPSTESANAVAEALAQVGGLEALRVG